MNSPLHSCIGYVVGGSLKDGLSVRLTVAPQLVQEGSFVVIESGDWQFYGLITDLQLGSTDPRFADEQSEVRLPGRLAGLLHGQTLYTNIQVQPALMLERGPDPAADEYEAWRSAHPGGGAPVNIKTVPAHHSLVRLASKGDVAEVFGVPGQGGFFAVGRTREQDHPVCIDLDRFVQRSSGIFGATGTGKSFLTRIILAGLMQRDKTSLLVFDMHAEYAYDDVASDTNQRVTGLHTKFRTKLRVAALGAGSSVRGHAPDFHLEIAESDITTADVEMLTRELDLKDTTPTTLSALAHDFGQNWFTRFKAMRNRALITNEDGKQEPAPDSVAAWARSAGVNEMAAEALHNKLKRLFHDARYIVAKPASQALKQIIDCLANGQHVILSFGDNERDLDYLLVTNLLTRRIRAEWEKKTNDHRTKGEAEPRPLVIVIEEAHKLLNREMAAQTAFATIAREMRKYYVTLLVVDQRLSQIYDEVMSQLGTRITGWLGDDGDIAAVLSGLAGRDMLRGMLSRLQEKEEVLLLGWGIKMPILVRSRRYDELFWEELQGKKPAGSSAERVRRAINDVY